VSRWFSVVLAVFVAAGAASAVLLRATPAYACSCASVPTAASLADSDAAFVGTVAVAPGDAEPGPGRQPDAQVTWEFDVDAVYKGELQARTAVLAPLSGGSCGLEHIGVGDEVGLLLYRDDIDGSQWTSNLCAQIEPAQLQATVDPRDPISVVTPDAVPDENDPAWGLIAAIAVVFLVAAGGAAYLWDRQRRKPAA
jgi:hypothetical protein